MTHSFQWLRCPHGISAFAIGGDDGSTRLTSGKCCKVWDTIEEIPVSIRDLRETVNELECVIDAMEHEEEKA